MSLTTDQRAALARVTACAQVAEAVALLNDPAVCIRALLDLQWAVKDALIELTPVPALLAYQAA